MVSDMLHHLPRHSYVFVTISIEDLKNPDTELSQFTTPHH